MPGTPLTGEQAPDQIGRTEYLTIEVLLTTNQKQIFSPPIGRSIFRREALAILDTAESTPTLQLQFNNAQAPKYASPNPSPTN